MISIVDEIKKIVPTYFDSNVLTDFLIRLESYSEDSEFWVDAGSAKKLIVLLDSIVLKFGADLKKHPELTKKIHDLTLKINWLYPMALDGNRKKELIGMSLLFAIKQGLNPIETISRWLDYYEFNFEPDKQRRADLLYLISDNEEIIGNSKIQLSTGEEASPTVKNWIKDYMSSVKESSVVTGNFDKINFLNKNVNVQKLAAQEKEILSKVIDIYRLLKYPKRQIAAQSSNAYIPSVVAPKLSTSSVSPTEPASKVIPAPNIVEKVIAPSLGKTLKSEFDQKLSQAGTPHGASLSSLRARIAERTVAEQQALSKKTPDLTPEEIKREVATPELPAHQVQKIVPRPVPMTPIIPKIAATQPVAPRPIPASPAKITFVAPKMPVANIQVVDDLKKLEVASLREGDLADQIRLIRNKISSLAAAGNLLPFYLVQAYEQSPLFRAYLLHGSDRVAGTAANADLTQEEFEALADLRKELGHL